MLIIVDYMLKNKWLILNLVAECLYLCAQLYMKLVNVYCELLLMISSFSPKQSTVSFFSPFVAFDYLRDCAKTKKKPYAYSHIFHIWVIFIATIFSFIFFFLTSNWNCCKYGITESEFKIMLLVLKLRILYPN